ncbi:MAG: helix-turn-helix domain-containing protein [Patescibacteria group bacterium]
MPQVSSKPSFIISLSGRSATIAAGDGTCLASSDRDKVGQEIKALIPSGENRPGPSNNKITLPLKLSPKITATLLLDKKNYTADQLGYLKNLAKLSLLQYIENSKPVTDPVDQLILTLLNTKSPEETALIAEEAKILGLSLEAQRLSILVELENFWDNLLLSPQKLSFERNEVIRRWKTRLENALKGFFTRNQDMITAYLGHDRFVIFKAISEPEEANFRRLMRSSYKSIFGPISDTSISGIRIGFGNSHLGAPGVIESYQEARLALQLGQKIHPEKRCHYFGDLGLLSILSDSSTQHKIKFAQKLLAKLASPELHQTLEVFLDNNLNLAQTARKLGIHRNTAIYRLNQINEVMGFDPRRFDNALLIKIALLINKYLA